MENNFFVAPNENICRHDSPTEPSGSVGGLSLGSVSFAAERILRVSESKENEFSLPNVSKMPKGNGTQRKAADGPARLKINVVH